jgi:hypothetical protein
MATGSSTAVERYEEDGVLASSILATLPYIYTGETPTKQLLGTTSCKEYYNMRSNMRSIEALYEVVTERLAPKKPPMWVVGGEFVKRETDPLKEMLHGLLSFPGVEKVIHCRKDRMVKIWVVSSAIDVKTKSRYCDYFALKRENLASDLLFNFRIVTPTSDEIDVIPSDAETYKRN